MRDLWDFENGATISQILCLNIEMGRLFLIREKHFVQNMELAIASVFNGSLASKYYKEIDKILADSDQFGSSEDPVKDDIKRRRTMKSIKELNKLNVLFN